MKRTDAFVAVSDSVADYVQEFLQLEIRPGVIANGVDLSAYAANVADRERLRAEWQIREDEVLLICVGRFAQVKNHRGLLNAFSRALEAAPQLRLALAGAGPLERDLWAQAEVLELGQRVVFLGFRDDVPACLAAADAMVIASSTEALPVCLLEAMAAGKPVISTAVGGIPRALGDPPAGMLVPHGDEAELAAALIRIGSDPLLRMRLAERSATRATEYSLATFASQYVDIYESLNSMARP